MTRALLPGRTATAVEPEARARKSPPAEWRRHGRADGVLLLRGTV